MPIAILVSRMRTSRSNGAPSATNTGNSSSLVERNTAISVPTVTSRPDHSVAATAEKPHWGTTPSTPPSRGPAFPAFCTASTARWAALVSRASMAR